MTLHTAGWLVSALATLPLVASGTMKLIGHPVVVQNLTTFGFRRGVLRPMGLLEYLFVALFLLPPTAAIGAILLTGWMGGAIATHLRAGDNFVVQTAIPLLVWAGYALRTPDVARHALAFLA